MSIKKQALQGFIWTYAEQFSGQIINFFVNIILARTLFPRDYGVLGMLFVFVSIANALVDGGMTISIIRKNDANEKDFSSVFYVNICLSIVLYCILYILAPFVADFYEVSELTSILRVYSLTILMQAFVVVQSAILIKNMDFRKQTLMKIPSIVISSIIGIVLAYKGFGVWSLVWMYLTQSFFWAAFHWVLSDWKPKFIFDKALFLDHFNYGYKLSITEILNSLVSNTYQIFIGKFYNVLNVGYYTQSLTLRQLPISNVYGAASKVFLPIFSKVQDDEIKLKATYKQMLSILLFILMPILIFLAFFSEPTIVLLYSEKWKVASPFLVHLSIAGIFGVICSYNLTVIKIVGESRLILKIEFFNKLQTFMFIALVFFFNLSINYLLYTISISAFISYLLISFFTSKYLRMGFVEGVFVVLKVAVISVLSSSCAYLLYHFFLKSYLIDVLNLFMSLFIGTLIYLFLIYLFERSIFTNLIRIVRK